MVYFISDTEKLNKFFGKKVKKSFLAPNLFLDAQMMVIPYVLECDAKYYLLLRHQERGNFISLKMPESTPTFYRPYFLVKKDGSEPASKNICEAVDSIVGNNGKNKVIRTDNNLPIKLYEQLRDHFKDKEICYADPINFEDKTTYVYPLSIKTVANIFNRIREKATNHAKMLVSDNPDEKILKKHIFDIFDTRFELLNKLMCEEGISSILINSTINIQELTGLPVFFDVKHRLAALYHKGTDSVILISEKQLPYSELQKPQIYRGFFKALANCLDKGTPLGFEEEYINISEYFALCRCDIDLKNSSLLLRKWREYRAGEDLVFYIITGQASKFAMESALKLACEKIKKGSSFTENWLAQHYFNCFNEFKIKNALEYNFSEYFTNLYASNRTLYPSLPSEFIIDNRTPNVKIDAGILLLNEKGLILGSSDIARILPLTDAAKEAYDYFQDIVINKIIKRVVPGKLFEEIHRDGLKIFSEQCQEMLKTIGLCPNDFNIIKDYYRDIGHLMGKQESFDFQFKNGNNKNIELNYIGCIEIQWSYNDYALAYEDMFYVGDEGTVNLSN